MDVSEALARRRSKRAFLEKPVDKDMVQTLLQRASAAPSGSNMQPWKVIVVTGDAIPPLTEKALTALAMNPKGEDDERPIYPADLKEPYATRRAENGEEMYGHLGIPRDDKNARLQWLMNNFRFFGAPVGLFFVIDRQMGHGQWAHLGMFMQSLALAAVEEGLDTCMQEAWAMVRKTLHTHLNLPKTDILYCGMALGYADPEAAVNRMATPRIPPAAFTRFEGF